ncbi:MAG: DUF2281 domain-containing protein [Acidobacteria bacterium]|nr:DUF2281 domain-containing protein [Acidobacteriota bacterium]
MTKTGKTKKLTPAPNMTEKGSFLRTESESQESALACALASEAVLAVDWLTSEEDEAGSHL